MAVGRPELRPGLFQVPTEIDVRARAFFVRNPISIPGMGDRAAKSKIVAQEIRGMPEYDQCLRRRVAIAASIEGIDAADGGRQAVFRAVKVDGTGFAVVAGQDAQAGTILDGQ